MPLEVIILAAGQGKRMHSRTPKVFHRVLDKPMLGHVISVAQQARADGIHTVVGSQMLDLAKQETEGAINWVLQEEPKGTGHAVLQAIPSISEDSHVLVLNGDAPLIKLDTITAILSEDPNSLVVVTAELPDPTGYGRIVRDERGLVSGIVEHRDATRSQRGLKEVNSGAMAASVRMLRPLLDRLNCSNAQGEYYLTDIVGLALEAGLQVRTVQADDPEEVLGINDRVQLAQAERILARRRAETLMKQGVTLRDPSRFDPRGNITAGLDCSIDINVVLEGEVILGEGVSIGPGCVLRDVEVGDRTRLHEYCVIESARIGSDCRVGPIARIRPGSVLEDEVSVGNFVEIKASKLKQGVRASHLAYIGDAELGTEVNVGAGAITCNFDGASKHRTIIGDKVFIGTNCTMVAPLRVGSGAFLAAGSTITSDVAGEVLAVGRARQRVISRWTPPQRRKKS
ncbi:MAG: bifunctional UDP-N-acetylglucosamine diphosphorylase/glucosamine-1-phosphate N-acetyltransferase GlmU [Gammaproteobacteria bacterium]|nr:bifunctional UDP-N-acetylglucosamine diphosphorylase/glucosamine-1-phosphate N-acetyltransferase GlmU [Gammaproteobacteria bacterium]